MEENQSKQADVMKNPFVRKMFQITYKMGVLGYGEDFIIENGLPQQMLETYMKRKTEEAIREAAKHFGLDDDTQLRSPATRTEKQQEYMLQYAAALRVSELDKYLHSDFIKTQHAIEEIFLERAKSALLEQGIPAEELERDEVIEKALESVWPHIELINTAFYASHPHYRPEESGVIQEQDLIELQQTALAISETAKANGTPWLTAVIEAFPADAEKTITVIPQSDTVYEPTSKPFRLQSVIGQYGKAGYDVNVGRHTKKDAVWVKTTISDINGNPVVITPTMIYVEVAIGNLIIANGGIRPIRVTPAQIYRRHAGLDVDTYVSPAQEAEMIEAMDKMLFYPSSIDFTDQIEKHPKMKQQSDYDYEGETSGKIKRTLIPGQKLEDCIYKGKRLPVVYEIYDYPSFFDYSHIVGQIASISRNLFAGEEKPVVKEDKSHGVKRNTTFVTIQHNILARIAMWKKEKEKSRIKKKKEEIIRIQEVAEDCGVQLTESKIRTLRKNIKEFLLDLQQKGEIASVEDVIKINKVEGYKITF